MENGGRRYIRIRSKVYLGGVMGSKIGTTRLYKTGGRTVFVASGQSCPRINLTEDRALKVRDDYSRGFRTSRAIFKAVFG